jgi:hypothetical protein
VRHMSSESRTVVALCPTVSAISCRTSAASSAFFRGRSSLAIALSTLAEESLRWTCAVSSCSDCAMSFAYCSGC